MFIFTQYVKKTYKCIYCTHEKEIAEGFTAPVFIDRVSDKVVFNIECKSCGGTMRLMKIEATIFDQHSVDLFGYYSI